MMDSEGMQALSAFVQSLLMLMVTAAAPVLIAYIRRYVTVLRDSAEDKYIEDVIRTVVTAAEQSGMAGYIQDKGSEKLNYAIDAAEKMLAERGLVLDIDPLRARIEAEVHRQFNWAKSLPPESNG